MEAFTLKNDKPKPKLWKAEAPPKKKQQVLFGGMNCLAGQEDLFSTDGHEQTGERMPRFMSFALTTNQVLAEQKIETRRLNTWADLQPGELFHAVEKCMGLRKGDKVKKLKLCRCISNHSEPLDAITSEGVEREGYPGKSPEFFIVKFCTAMKCDRSAVVNVIRFEYVDAQSLQ